MRRLRCAVKVRCRVSLPVLFVGLLRAPAIPASPAKLSGHIAFLRKGAAYVVAAQGGTATRLPLSQPASGVVLSRRDGNALYATTTFKIKNRVIPNRALTSVAPYQSARPLPPLLQVQLQGAPIGGMTWSNDGQAMLVGAPTASWLAFLQPAPVHLVRLPFFPDSVSREGQVSAIGGTSFVGPNQIKVFLARSGRSETIFSSQKPQALFTLIRRAKLRPLLDADNFAGRPLATPSEYWSSGPAAVSPDGKSVYFATNAGAVLSGAGGNTTFCLVKADIATRKLSLPTRFVWEGARLPYSTRVSPDGRRILLVVASHSSARDNSSQAYALDLKTRKMTRLLAPDAPFTRGQANLIGGDCWSPDSRFVALSVFYYDPQKVGADAADNAANYTLLIKDAATGRTVRTIKGAVNPSWGG